MQESYELLDLDRLNRVYWHKRMVQLKAELRQPIATVPHHAPVTSEPRYGHRQGQLRSTTPARSRPVGVESDGQ